MIEFCRFFMASVLAFAVDFSVLVSLTENTEISYIIAAAIGFCLGVFVKYNLCIKYVFNKRRYKKIRAEFSIYFIIALIGLFINQASMLFFVEFLDIYYIIAKLLTAFLVFLIVYILQRRLLFS